MHKLVPTILGAGLMAMGLLTLPAFAIDFGDDTSEWANDGECDDPRFSGPAAANELLNTDIMHDASDCQAAYESGRVEFGTPTEFGDDTGTAARNGICDDPAYEGPGVTPGVLSEDDRGRDATDCWQAVGAGRAGLVTTAEPSDQNGREKNERPAAAAENQDPAPIPSAAARPDFGDNTSKFSADGECDDPRFEGEGMTMTPLLEGDAMHDATDCEAAFDAGTIRLKS